MNIGNPREMTIKQFAEEIIRITGTKARIEYGRCRWTIRKCASRTSGGRRKILGWEPKVEVRRRNSRDDRVLPRLLGARDISAERIGSGRLRRSSLRQNTTRDLSRGV